MTMHPVVFSDLVLAWRVITVAIQGDAGARHDSETAIRNLAAGFFDARAAEHHRHRIVPFVTCELEHIIRIESHWNLRCPRTRPGLRVVHGKFIKQGFSINPCQPFG